MSGMEGSVQDVDALFTFERVCKSASMQVTREICRKKYRVVHKTCQDSEEVEVSIETLIW